MCCVRVLGIYSALLVERGEDLACRSCLRAVRNNLGIVLLWLLFMGPGEVVPLSAGTLGTRGAYKDRISGVRDIEVMCGSSSFLPVLHLSVCFSSWDDYDMNELLYASR